MLHGILRAPSTTALQLFLRCSAHARSVAAAAYWTSAEHAAATAARSHDSDPARPFPVRV